MTWYGMIVLIATVVGVAVLMKALYGHKDSPTPCIGCGKCIGTGECVMRREELERRKRMEEMRTRGEEKRFGQKSVGFFRKSR